jgi:hypothetical protein
MSFLHSELDLTLGNVVEVTLDKQANVMLLDSTNFHAYQSGRGFEYFGGLATRSPFTVTAPRTGRWHLVIDLGGGSGTLRHSIRVL